MPATEPGMPRRPGGPGTTMDARDALDGNAIGGLLLEVFGAEMTTAMGRCGSCGTASVVAELDVYLQAPGTVARCRTCGAVLMVFVQAYGMRCVDLSGLADLSANH
jgi:Family of unknown function (DUF6510)